jgi:very-short-patch-repair endonuclease
MSPPEARLWTALRGCRLEGLKFRRQHPFGPYVLDFYCPAARLAVEIDGWGHNTGGRPQKDERRDAWLVEQGVRTLRLPATAVKDLDGALRMIWVAASG